MRYKCRLRAGAPADMPHIAAKALAWDLDATDLAAERCIVAVDQEGGIIGFGRIKRYANCWELCTVGVEPARRGEGIGRTIVEKLIDMFPSRDVWITTDLTEYFGRFGFRVIEKGPKELHEKILGNHCCRRRENVRIMLLRRSGKDKRSNSPRGEPVDNHGEKT